MKKKTAFLIMLDLVTKMMSAVLNIAPTLFVGHLCQNPTDDHLPGLNCLSDEQLLPILLHMDPDTLLNIGR